MEVGLTLLQGDFGGGLSVVLRYVGGIRNYEMDN